MGFKNYLNEENINEALTPDKVKLLGLIDDYGNDMYAVGSDEGTPREKKMENIANKRFAEIKKLIEKM